MTDAPARRKSMRAPMPRQREQLADDVLTLARERVKHAFDRFDSLAVLFSGGKDSTVCLNLAIEEARARRRQLRVIFWDEEAIPYQTAEYVERVTADPVVQMEWLCLPVKHRNACSRKSPFWYPWAPEDEPLWTRPWPERGIATYPGFPVEPKEARLSIPDMNGLLFHPARDGNAGMIMGIRAQESITRQRAVSRRTLDNWIVKYSGMTDRGNLWKVYPIYDWRTEDVWTAPKALGWDYNCNPAEAPIWMADYTFRPVAGVREGDEIIGWTDDGADARARLTKARVLAVHEKKARVVRITLASGRIIRCTADHKWLSLASDAANRNWRYAVPRVGRYLAHIVDLPEPLRGGMIRHAAWLGGVYDGEGSGNAIYQNPGTNPDVHAKIGLVLDLLGVPSRRLNDNSAAQHGWRISGGRAGVVKFVNACLPVRRQQFDKLLLTERFRNPDEIVEMVDDGEETVYALTTGTGNYVAWGFGSSNSAYDYLEMAGVPPHLQRCAPPFGEEPLEKLWTYACCFPELWAKMCERVPGAATAARYARSSLYAYSTRMEKPPDMTWQDFILRYVEMFEGPVRVVVARRIKQIIERHYKQTTDPIMPSAVHPLTGVSWRFLLTIAQRGDFKQRKQPGAMIRDTTPAVMAEYWAKYNAERAATGGRV